jgi:hypothetical protein
MKTSKGNTNNLISVGAAKVLWYAIHPPNISIKPNYFITKDQSGLKSESLLTHILYEPTNYILAQHLLQPQRYGLLEDSTQDPENVFK